MRFGAPVFGDMSTPEKWIELIKVKGYRAAYSPIDHRADSATRKSYATAAQNADIIIAETGAWSNPLDPNLEKSTAAILYCQKQLDLAEEIGARCCVNITGSRGEIWDGPHKDNLTTATFDKIVEITRKIIDAVNPKRTFYTLETMPWMYPDSTKSYVRLIKAIDRPQFAVHFDPVNLICSPQRYFAHEDLIRDFCDQLGAHIKSCHIKDMVISSKLLTHIDEVRPGLGTLNYPSLLKELSKLDADLPIMLEHLPNADEYELAAEYVREMMERI